ncbi:MAG: helix-turn-helix transcriptional regulator [Lachnospiraceae bacterium]|nr:helix-turn-helix transcriptional regulator [Lachnospiraceae bacterium]
MNTGQNIKNFRKLRGLTQKELAQKIGVAEITLRQYENNKREPRIETIQKIASALNVRLVDIVDAADFQKLISKEVDAVMDSHIKSGKVRIIETDEQELVSDYLKLNKSGKSKAREYVKDLTLIPGYTKKDTDPDDQQTE